MHEAESIVAMIVGEDEYDIAPPARLREKTACGNRGGRRLDKRTP